jgi:hypothetical protein
MQLPTETDSQSDTSDSEPTNTCGHAEHGSRVSTSFTDVATNSAGSSEGDPPQPVDRVRATGARPSMEKCRARAQLRRLIAEYDRPQWIRHHFPSAAADAG